MRKIKYICDKCKKKDLKTDEVEHIYIQNKGTFHLCLNCFDWLHYNLTLLDENPTELN